MGYVLGWSVGDRANIQYRLGNYYERLTFFVKRDKDRNLIQWGPLGIDNPDSADKGGNIGLED